MDFQEYDDFQELYKAYREALKKLGEKKKNKFKPFDRVITYMYQKQAKLATYEAGTVAEVDGDLCLVIFDSNNLENTMTCKRLGVCDRRALWIDYKNLNYGVEAPLIN